MGNSWIISIHHLVPPVLFILYHILRQISFFREENRLRIKWSRRIDDEHRLVYQMQDDNLIIYMCKSLLNFHIFYIVKMQKERRYLLYLLSFNITILASAL